MKTMKRSLIVLSLIIGLSVPMFAQTATSRFVTNSAVTVNTTTVILLSASGITASAFGADTFLYIDRELMKVTAVNTTTGYVTVTRGQAGTSATPHISGALVWYGTVAVFPAGEKSGLCTRAANTYLPVVVPISGNVYDCILSTTNTTSEWTRLNTLQSGFTRPYKKTALSATSYTLLATDEILGINTNVGFTVTLPAISGMFGKTYIIKNETAIPATLTIAPTGSETINGGSAGSSVTVLSTSGNGAFMYYDGAGKWFIIP